LAAAILPDVPSTAAEQLEKAYSEVRAANGPDFFRRLRDYIQLLKTDKKIRAAVKQLRQEVEEAEADFDREDDGFVAELVSVRQALAKREPKVDDSAAPRPAYDPVRRANAEAVHGWIWTLSNFDAIVDGREDRVIERDGLDASRSRMLVAILRAKLYDLVIPFNGSPAPRPDLRDLYDDMNEIGGREVAAHRRLEQFGEESGILGLLHLERIAAALDPKPPQPMRTPEEKRQVLKQALVEYDLAYLREAIRPKEGRGSLDAKAQQAVDRHEAECRTELERLHRPLKKRLDKNHSWPRIVVGRVGWMPSSLWRAIRTLPRSARSSGPPPASAGPSHPHAGDGTGRWRQGRGPLARQRRNS
jgi:hypothetical protein